MRRRKNQGRRGNQEGGGHSKQVDLKCISALGGGLGTRELPACPCGAYAQITFTHSLLTVPPLADLSAIVRPRLHYRLLTLCPAAYSPCAPVPALAHRVSRPRGSDTRVSALILALMLPLVLPLVLANSA